jgi:hypothetical protein
VKFFIDNCISKGMATAVAAIAESQGHEVIHLTRDFDPSTPDTVWIPAIKDKGYVIISGDPRISRNPVNKAAWLESGLTAFFLGDGFASRRIWVQAEELMRWFPHIIETVKECSPGSGFLLPFKGTAPKEIYRPPDPLPI